MSAPLGCPRCGFQNQPGFQFCTNCGAPLGPAVAGTAPAPAAAYTYAPPSANPEWTKQVDRTKTGVFLLFVGSLLSWLPFYLSILGELLLFVGALLVIFGRKPFGATHARNVLLSIVLFVVGIGIVIVVAIAALLPTVPSIVNSGGVLTPQAMAAAQAASLLGAIASAIVIGVAEVLFTYALQKPLGRAVLWAGYAANLAVAVVLWWLLTPVYNAVTTGAGYQAALDQQATYALIAVVPALVFALADYLAWSRIRSGEIPAPPTVPSAPWTPPVATAPPRPPQAPPPSGPAPPINPP